MENTNSTCLYDERELGAILNVPRQEWPTLWNTPIYQILPIPYLECIVRLRKLRFGNILKSWEDPYELFFYKQNVQFEKTNLHDLWINIAKHHYGQCWSSLRDSDAMWRIYSKDKHSVRIRTTFGKMMDVIYQVEGIAGMAAIFGKVRYVEKEDIIQWLKLTEQEGWGHIIERYSDSLFIKRKEFLHESEYRFILDEWTEFDGKKRPVRNEYYLDIDPFNFIEEIAVDPRLSSKEFTTVSASINEFVDNNIPIVQSDLYKFDPVTILFHDEPIIINSKSTNNNLYKAPRLSIITINYNNAEGLRKTLASVATQTYRNIEHIIIDGGSTDCSVDVIKEYAERSITDNRSPLTIIWSSERDNGIYHAMNKGIRKASGLYVEILNSGDVLAAPDVTERMVREVEKEEYPAILYGNMLKSYDGKKIINRDTCGNGMYTPESFLYFYNGTLNHDCAYIRRDLFEKYGLYNEDMKICADWEWYVKAIVLGGEKPVYTNIDVTIFDMNGISESGGKNKELIQKERREYLEKILPPAVLHDYDAFSFPILQYQRLKKYHLWGLVYFLERVLFKLGKWHVLK